MKLGVQALDRRVNITYYQIKTFFGSMVRRLQAEEES